MSQSESGQHTAALQFLVSQLEAAYGQNNAIAKANGEGTAIAIPGLGKKFASAYEQLRNAAEYTEEHLLLQRAIRRFYTRSLIFHGRKSSKGLGEELIVELTQAGYLHSTFSHRAVVQLTQLIDTWTAAHTALRDHGVSREKATEWATDMLSVASEDLLNPRRQLNALAYFAYHHYRELIPEESFIASEKDAEQYEICLYIAVQQALLKSDLPSTRHTLANLYQQTPSDIRTFITFNQRVDELYMAAMTQKLKRVVSKYGAPLRILKSIIDDRPNSVETLRDRTAFLTLYDHYIAREYTGLTHRLNRGIIKSIIFIFITKVIIGLAVEVPYDLLVIGSVAIVPLAINLLFPPLYMASLKLGLRTPSSANTHALHNYIDTALYSPAPLPRSLIKISPKTASLGAKLLYSVLFFVPLGITVYLLSLLHFNIVQGIIFFVFLSTASFLGFRLAHLIRELEIVLEQHRLLSTIRDFFYLPFILVGQWLSAKYAKVNAVAFILDMTIELPLKTVLRLTRQWTRFLNEKREELY